jgi:hypothetical protein
MSIKELAETMGQSDKDVAAFVECLRVWISKGYTIEQAIEKHMQQMTRIASNAASMPRAVAVQAFYA